MQKLQYFLFIVGVLLFNINDTISMEAVEVMKPKIPSLKRLCANKLAKLIRQDPIDTLLSKDNKIFNLPEELNEKITQGIIYCNPSHKFSYGDGPSLGMPVVGLAFDESNSQIMFCKGRTFTTFTIDAKQINFFSWLNEDSYDQKGSLLVRQDWEDGSLHIIEEGKQRIIQPSYLPTGCIIEEILNNQQEIICLYKGKYILYDLGGKKIIYNNADLIRFNSSQKKCMVRNGDKLIIYTRKFGQLNDNADAKQVHENYAKKYEYKQQMMLDGIKKAYLNSNGEQLLIKREDQPVELISIEGQKIVFSFKNLENIDISTVNFSACGRYLVVSQNTQVEGFRDHYVLDTTSGKICMNLHLSIHTNPSFDKEYLVLRRSNNQVCLIHIKNLCKMNNFSKDASPYTIEKILELGLGKVFNNFAGFHPNGKYIIFNNLLQPDSDSKWQLVDLKTGESVLVADNIITHKFSPTGKMLFLARDWYDGCEVISLRDDLTATEYLLLRLMIEKNIPKSDLPKHLQEIFNGMSEDKKKFFCNRGRKNTPLSEFAAMQNQCVIS